MKNFDEHLQILWTKIGKCLVENDIISAKDVQIKHFNPHITIMKLSKMKSKTIRKIQPELHEDFNNITFGVQPVQKIEVLSMTHPPQPNGYYYCQHSFPILSKFNTINQCFKNSFMILSGATALLAFAYIIKKLNQK